MPYIRTASCGTPACSYARVAMDRGELDKAQGYLTELIKTWQGQREELARTYISLAEIQSLSKNNDAAIKSLQEADAMKASGAKLSREKWMKAAELRGDLLLQQKKPVAAVETYLKMLEEYESKTPRPAVRFKAGRILYEMGDVRGAEKIWSSLKDDPSGVYAKLADEKLKDRNWQDEYKKYIQRIPAMEGTKVQPQ